MIHAAGENETHLFRGEPKVFFLAHCTHCWPDKFAPMPFGTPAERETWADAHATTGHTTINFYVEVRT